MNDLAQETLEKAKADLAKAHELINRATEIMAEQPIHGDDQVSEVFNLCKHLQSDANKLTKKIDAYTTDH